MGRETLAGETSKTCRGVKSCPSLLNCRTEELQEEKLGWGGGKGKEKPAEPGPGLGQSPKETQSTSDVGSNIRRQQVPST